MLKFRELVRLPVLLQDIPLLVFVGDVLLLSCVVYFFFQ